MKQVYRIDHNGFYVEPVILEENEPIPSDCVEGLPLEGLLKLKWNGEAWEEGATLEEQEAFLSQIQPVSELEHLKQENQQLKKRVEETENAILQLMDMNLA